MQQYYCPSCRSPVAAGEQACRRCGQVLTWTPAGAAQQDKRQPDADEQPEVKRHWLWPLLALIFIVVLAGAGIYIMMRMAEKQPAVPAAENTAADIQEGAIIPDVRAPIISNISVGSLSYNSVEIRWTTDEPSSSQVLWRMEDGSMTATDEKEAVVNQHVVELTDLKNKHMYYFRVRSVDQSHNEAISVEDSFDIGLSHGVAAITVLGDSYKTEEPQPSVFRTVISGKVKNTGDVPIRTKDIEVWIKITVAGKAGTIDVKADIDPTPEFLNPLYQTGFRAVVPARTNPDYVITSSIADQER